ncbi:dTDP-glucose pyrophosphorylase [Pontibacter qinzhouensis]|uniref:glucose-1-phosphate thymidylyltransferase n=1 Tax=Pontibacter qinzhouensis TaxID=2603253 RepID=A0A5C8IH88_9BACT|nr:sugar phosphate nucleotidyltransferase [Pontibacter qinzhouensis]TXK21069.1 dTDP-glucose pyrophosphorylase [Pontibacter qinzhouensis]
MEIAGLVPAAGLGSRLSPLPCSKELFPVGFGPHPEHGEPHPKVVSQYLLEQMQRAGAKQVYFVLRKGKWDIPAYFGDGSQLSLHLAYLLMQNPNGTPFSLNQAYDFVQDKQVLFGFPDILTGLEDPFSPLLQKQERTQADVVLGLFKIKRPHSWDMVATAPDGEVTALEMKSTSTTRSFGWAIACWQPSFTLFMHRHLQHLEQQMSASGQVKEISVGAVIQAAIYNGLQVQSVCFPGSSCLDMGTPEDLREAISTLT